MRNVLKSKCMRSVAWILIITTLTLTMPVGLFAYSRPDRDQAAKAKAVKPTIVAPKKAAKVSKPAPRPDVRVLSLREMESSRGRGSLRNPNLCGLLPWHRSLNDVNLCTGNLFKSFTDIQIAPGRGTGLVLQRTYNSNDPRPGPFGRGWMHAYDIRIQEAGTIQTGPDSEPIEVIERTDFFGAKHTYKRDADGLYTPPPYMYSAMSSNYKRVLAGGPAEAVEDYEYSKDGGVKHFIKLENSNERVCDYIKDRFGNGTKLSYEYVNSNGTTSSTKLLVRVTEFDNDDDLENLTERHIDFTWNNFGTSEQPAWRIVRAQALGRAGALLYDVAYDYYTPEELYNQDPRIRARVGGEPYNLKSVRLDPDGLNRRTTYTYTTYGADDKGLLSGIEDGLAPSDPTAQGYSDIPHAVRYRYEVQDLRGHLPEYVWPLAPPTLWVVEIREPGSRDYDNAPAVPRSNVWSIGKEVEYDLSDPIIYTVYSCTGGAVSRLWAAIGWPYLYHGGFGMYHFTINSYWEVYNDYYDDGTYNVRYHADTPCYWSHVPSNGAFSSQLYPRIGTNYSYNRLGDVTESYVSDWPQHKTKYSYYGGRKCFQKKDILDASNRFTTFDYYDVEDPNPGNRGNLQIAVQDATPPQPEAGKTYLNLPTTYTYNQYGQKTSETKFKDGQAVVTRYYYDDAWGNLTRVVEDEGPAPHLNRTTEMEYFETGQIKKSTDPNGQQSDFTYNAVGQIKTASFPAKPNGTDAEMYTYAYGDNGRLDGITSSIHGATTISYEADSDRVSAVSDSITNTTVSYQYGIAGERRKVTLPGGRTWTYEYFESEGWGTQSGKVMLYAWKGGEPGEPVPVLRSITDNQGRTVEYGQSSRGQVSHACVILERDAGGYAARYLKTEYIPEGGFQNYPWLDYGRGWLWKVKTSYCYKDGQGNMVEKPIAMNQYNWDNIGNRIENKIATSWDGSDNPISPRTEQYSYDGLYRLTQAIYGDGDWQNYTFDEQGNRLTRTGVAGGAALDDEYEYNNANMLLSKGSDSYINDANGNTLSGGGRINTWNSQNRLVRCITNGVINDFIYGPDGLRRSSIVDSVRTDYVLDGQSVIQELRNGSPIATYLTGPRGPECRIDESTSDARWYVYDGLGSVVAEVDQDGRVNPDAQDNEQDIRKYDAYGVERIVVTDGSSNHRFVGQLGHPSEADTGLIYMRARYYDPALGRFISEDPAEHGSNWYIYCNNNPVNAADPNGCWPVWIVVGAIVALVAIIAHVVAEGLGHLSEEEHLHIPGAEENPALPAAPGGVGNRGERVPPWAERVRTMKTSGSMLERIAAGMAEMEIYSYIALYQ